MVRSVFVRIKPITRDWINKNKRPGETTDDFIVRKIPLDEKSKNKNKRKKKAFSK